MNFFGYRYKNTDSNFVPQLFGSTKVFCSLTFLVIFKAIIRVLTANFTI